MKGRWETEDVRTTYGSTEWWLREVGQKVSWFQNKSFLGLLFIIAWAVSDVFFIFMAATSGALLYQIVATVLTTEGVFTTPITISSWAAKSGDLIYGATNALIREHFNCCDKHQEPFHKVAIRESGRLSNSYNHFLPLKDFTKEGKDSEFFRLCNLLADAGKNLDPIHG